MVPLQRIISFNRPSFIRLTIQARNSSSKETKAVSSKNDVWTPIADEDEALTLAEEKEAQIERQRNKSKLLSGHRNIVNGRMPYEQSYSEYHNSLKYKKKMFGSFGNASGIDPGTLWPSADQMQETLNYEKTAYPLTIQEMVAMALEKNRQEEEEIKMRMERISHNLMKLDQWKKEVHNRASKKMAEIAAAKAKKDALIEEVRRHFGHKIDPRDEKFKEMLLQKEKDQKKKLKQQRAKEKQERLFAKYVTNAE